MNEFFFIKSKRIKLNRESNQIEILWIELGHMYLYLYPAYVYILCIHLYPAHFFPKELDTKKALDEMRSDQIRWKWINTEFKTYLDTFHLTYFSFLSLLTFLFHWEFHFLSFVLPQSFCQLQWSITSFAFTLPFCTVTKAYYLHRFVSIAVLEILNHWNNKQKRTHFSICVCAVWEMVSERCLVHAHEAAVLKSASTELSSFWHLVGLNVF